MVQEDEVVLFIRAKILCQYYPDKYLRVAKALKSLPDLRPFRHKAAAQGVSSC
jgi:hypothetical protein